MEKAFPGWPHRTEQSQAFQQAVLNAGTKDPDALFRTHPEVKAAFERFFAGRPRLPSGDKRWGWLKLMAAGVKYCEAAVAKEKYQVDLGPVIRRRNEVFDSEALFNKATKKYAMGSFGGAGEGRNKFKSIWVMVWEDRSQPPEFYSHIGKIGRFHHSSFKAGGRIAAAGEWLITDGKCEVVSGCSGHYKPEPWRLLLALDYLKKVNVITDATKLEVWLKDTTNANRKQLVNCITFTNRWERNMRDYQLFP
jgi:hypothetical protein